MSVSTAAAWLKIASAVLLIGFGLLFAIGAYPPLSGPVLVMAEAVVGETTPSNVAIRLLMAVGGGITAGWGLTIWLIADKLLPKDPAMARSILVPSILFWFVIDSTFSALAGAAFNIAPNVVFAAALLWPLMRMEMRPIPAVS